MKEFIEKLIGRLEEIPVENQCSKCPHKVKCDEIQENINNDYTDLCGATIKALAIEIVNQLAEEHKHCALCYLGSPCEYQNENAEMQKGYWNSGWIPCENELPKEYTDVLGCDYNGNIYVVQFYKDSIFGNIWRQWNGGILRLDVIVAWCPLPAPYKGEQK